ncbi:MAG TPA: tetratricopeptide repeat protein [Chthoniobacteraceae bacterium]|nr:tetratricopeptide repeat protein [Chthoniobacteraceae bacterium]
MNRIGLLLLPVFALFALPLGSFAQEVDPSEAFLKAYMTAQQAEKLERENQFKPALAKFRFAGSMLEELKKNNGEWQPAIVEYRSRKIAEAILRVQSKIETQTDLAATAQSPPTEKDEAVPPDVVASEPIVEIGSQPARPNPIEVQVAIQDATEELRARVEALETELKKSQKEISTAQKEKSEISSKLEKTNAELEQAKVYLAKTSQAEKEVRDQLTAAQESLQVIQSSGTGDEKAAAALQGQITQLKKALEAAQAGRTAAEKESGEAKSKLVGAQEKVASVAQERDTMQRERDDALRELKIAGDAKSRVQVLMTENTGLQKKLAAAENTVREISADRPRKVQELQEVKKQLEKLRGQLVASQKANQDSEKMIADLRAQLDEASGELATAKLKGATPEETERLAKENQMLRAIVVRERQEEARREQAKKLMLSEFDKLKIKSDVLDQQIQLLAEPIAKLSPEELALLKTPVVTISDTAPGTVKASLTMAKPSGSVTIGNSTEIAETTKKASLESVAPGGGRTIGPEADANFNPVVPPDLLPLAREAKASFDRGKYKQAEKQYQEILTKSPNNLYSLSNLGVVLFHNGKLKAAELTLKKAIAIAPKDEFAHTTLGIVYYQQSKFDDALTELTQSLAINPKSATAHNYLGITASQKGWQEAAEKEMLAAIEENPNYADAHFNLAVIYSSSEPPAKELARRHYEKALALGAQPDPTLDKLLR